eukprot:GHVS01019988.1.p1 GENE.GHVS01019988.1~~GHVS01019988.1.p1  ORF type:complete len:254 (-),score=27.55 GHVS01019988.1:260-940(-)
MPLQAQFKLGALATSSVPSNTFNPFLPFSSSSSATSRNLNDVYEPNSTPSGRFGKDILHLPDSVLPGYPHAFLIVAVLGFAVIGLILYSLNVSGSRSFTGKWLAKNVGPMVSFGFAMILCGPLFSADTNLKVFTWATEILLGLAIMKLIHSCYSSTLAILSAPARQPTTADAEAPVAAVAETIVASAAVAETIASAAVAGYVIRSNTDPPPSYEEATARDCRGGPE